MNSFASWHLKSYSEDCLMMMSFFLNVLWAVLFWVWLVATRKYPRETFGGGSPTLFHLVIALSVWLITFTIAVKEFEPAYYFLAFAISNGVFLSVLNPVFALCFCLTMMLMRPWEIMDPNIFILAIPRFSMALTTGWSLFYWAILDRFALRVNKVVLMVLVYATWILITTVVTPDGGTARETYGDTIVRAVTLFFLIYHLARDRFSVWAVKVSLVTIFTCVGAISLMFFFDGYREDNRLIAFGLFKNSNDIAAVMTLMLPLAAAPFFKKTSGKLEKWVAVIPIVIAALVIYYTQSRGAVLSVVAAFGAYFYFKIKNKALALGVIITVVVAGQIAMNSFQRNESDLEGSTESRMSFWKAGFRMALFNPVFGVGFTQFPSNFERYAVEIVGEWGKHTAHSTWILALAETGPIGCAMIVWIYFVGALKNGRRLIEEEPAWFYSAVCYGTCITFLSHTYVIFPYILVASIVSAASAKDSADQLALMGLR